MSVSGSVHTNAAHNCQDQMVLMRQASQTEPKTANYIQQLIDEEDIENQVFVKHQSELKKGKRKPAGCKNKMSVEGDSGIFER